MDPEFPYISTEAALIVTAIIIAAAIILCRVFGWALGISAISEHLRVVRKQNKEAINTTKELIKIQKAIAEKQGITLESDEPATD